MCSAPHTCAPDPRHTSTAGPVLLRSATVVDTRDGTLASDTDVLLRDGVIAEVRRGTAHARDTAADTPAEGLRVVDAHGLFVVPGYNDMHAHPLGQAARDTTRDLKLMLGHGVTGFRQMSGSVELLHDRAAGALGMPESSPALLALPGPMLIAFLNAATEDQAVETVREQHAAGADFIKVAMVTPDVFFAAQAEATRLGLSVVGHLPADIDVFKASRLGMRSIEHLGPGVGLFECCVPYGAHVFRPVRPTTKVQLPTLRLPLMDRLMERTVKKLVLNPVNRSTAEDAERLRVAVSRFDEESAERLAGHFVEDGTWQVPTLIRVKTQQLCDDREFATDPGLRYMDRRALRNWRKAAARFSRFTPQIRAVFRDVYEHQLRLTGVLDRCGVPMLTGSDCSGAAWVVPGRSLHQEFDELGRAGVPALRVLQMATLRAAEFLGTTATAGTVEAGKNADLVLLEGNPLDDVANLQRIAGVVRAGRHYSAAELATLMARAAAER